MRIGIIVDQGRVAPWQAAALAKVADGNEFIVYDCLERRSPRRSWLRHAIYYGLNLVQARAASGPSVPLPPELQIVARHAFRAEWDQGWDRLPQALLEQVRTDRVAAIVKFGLGLLRVPPPDLLAAPILSYHHGDPRRFRGRPAGWWEMVTGERRMGQMVQRLSNRLDGGAVLAFAETKVVPHSWKATLRSAYRLSPLLLAPAIERAVAGRSLPMEPSGRNYRLPGNAAAARAVLAMTAAGVRRLAYGAFAEKRWQVSTAPLSQGWSPDCPDALDQPERWTTLPRPDRFTFLADPFFAPDGTIVVEAMRHDGRGAIVRMRGGSAAELTLADSQGHCSYPLILETDGATFLLPEISGWSAPRLYRMEAGRMIDCGELDLPGRPRLLDPTLHEEDGRFYLFGNCREEGDGILRLWSADRLEGPYAEHPSSPILVSPDGCRMGGPLFQFQGQLYRAGQDLTGGYGDGLSFFRVEEITPDRYVEERCGHVRFRSCRGPHTIGIRDGIVLFDHYRDEISPLAGIRRLRQSRSG